MRVIAINGSPRKNGNTATMLKEVLAGAADAGAETRFIHLNDLDMKGCQ
jgi:multimeric flavodoxin WrbA